MDFDWDCLLGNFQSSQLICTRHNRECKIRCSRKTVLMTFSGFIGLCRISTPYHMELLNKKLTGPGPEITLDPSVAVFFTFFFLWFYWGFFMTFFLTENREAAFFTGDQST